MPVTLLIAKVAVTAFALMLAQGIWFKVQEPVGGIVVVVALGLLPLVAAFELLGFFVGFSRWMRDKP